VLSADLLPDLLLRGSDALTAPVSSFQQKLGRLQRSEASLALLEALGKFAWVGIWQADKLVEVANWSSWARFTSHHRLTRPYLFSPEWGRNDAVPARA
jgi:hypothetical protein